MAISTKKNEVVLQGVIVGIYENEKSDAIVIDDGSGDTQKITMFKGDAKKLSKFKDVEVEVGAEQSEFNGRVVYRTSANKVRPTGNEVKSKSKVTTASLQKATHQGSSDYDRKQDSIVFQSMAKVAVELAIHNASISGRPITTDEIIELATILAKAASKPDLSTNE